MRTYPPPPTPKHLSVCRKTEKKNLSSLKHGMPVQSPNLKPKLSLQYSGNSSCQPGRNKTGPGGTSIVGSLMYHSRKSLEKISPHSPPWQITNRSGKPATTGKNQQNQRSTKAIVLPQNNDNALIHTTAYLWSVDSRNKGRNYTYDNGLVKLTRQTTAQTQTLATKLKNGTIHDFSKTGRTKGPMDPGWMESVSSGAGVQFHNYFGESGLLFLKSSPGI